LVREGRYVEAERSARELLAAVETTHGSTSLEAAYALDLLFECLSRGGKLNRAETSALAERSRTIRESVLGHEDVRLATSLDNLGTLRQAEGDFEGARSLFERALDLRERALGMGHVDVATSCYNLGLLHYQVGDFDAAQRFHQRALAVREEALGPVHLDVSSSLNNLALIHWETGDYVASRPLFERALAIRENTLGPEHPRVAGILNNFAILLADMGELDEARRMFEHALAIRERTLADDHPELASTIHNLAEVLWLQGDLSRAEGLVKRALEIWRETGDRPGMGWSLEVLGALEYSRGDNRAAQQHFERALSVWKGTLGRDHPIVAYGLNSLAGVLRDTGKLDQSRALFDRALEIRRATLGRDHPSVGIALSGLAELLYRNGEGAACLDAALEAEKIGRRHLRLTARGLAEQQSLRYASVRASGLDLALTVTVAGIDPEDRRDVLDAVIRSRAVVLDEMASRHRSIAGSQDPEVAELVERLTRARTRLANLVVRGVRDGDPERYLRSVRDVRREKEEAERELAEKSARFRSEQTRRRIGLTELADSLPRDGALVSYVLFDAYGPSDHGRAAPFYVAFVLRHGEGTPAVVPLGRASDIDDRVSRWRLEVSRGVAVAGRSLPEAETAYRRRGEELRQVIWSPVADLLTDTKHLFIVPDGELHVVSLATLPTGDGRYLVERGPVVHYLSSERDLVPVESAGEGNAGLLALGAPAFDARPTTVEPPEPGASVKVATVPLPDANAACPSFQKKRFTSLPTTLEEVEEIGSLWKEREGSVVVTLTGAEASEATFKSEAPGRRVLHLATHGFFLSGQCLPRSGETRGIGGLSPAEPLPASAVSSPLTLSGLALAGANHRSAAGPDEPDGILTAEEIAALDLSGTQWAVLSACDTGLGEIRAGEGVFGLRRAFQVAGVDTVIMSLWQVEDAAAREWMRRLYAARVRGGSTAEAVRDASLQCLLARRRAKDATHPFYWGAFVAAGDWR
jgi:CHAT domain-containing protein/tetratricopeptide (TPR) repeat protein